MNNFWQSLEVYTWKACGRFPLPYPWIGVAIVALVLVGSLLGAKNSVVGVRSTLEVVEKAVEVGDYETARKMYQASGSTHQVLGAESELENLVYPERVVERRITEVESLLEQYPSHRDILLELSRLYGQLGDQEKAQDYWEQARILDPNNEMFAGE